VALLVEAGAHAIFLAQRGEKPECRRQQALALKELQHSYGSREDHSIEDRLIDHGARIDQQLGAFRTRVRPFSSGVEAVAVGAGCHRQHSSSLPSPGEQAGMLLQQLPQPPDVIVVNALRRLTHGPFQALAQAGVYLRT